MSHQQGAVHVESCVQRHGKEMSTWRAVTGESPWCKLGSQFLCLFDNSTAT